MEMSEAEPTPNENSPRANRTPLVLAIGMTALGLLIVCVALIFLLRDTVGGDGLTVLGNPSPTPFGVVTTGNRGVVVAADLGETPGVSLTLSIPTTMMVGGKSYAVTLEDVPPAGNWAPELADEDTAVWAYGTVINYVLGVNSSNENRQVLESLAPGDEIRLTMQDGTQYLFVVTAREIVPSSQADLFRQQNPGVTIVMLGSGGTDRLVVRGDYQTTQGGPAAGTATASNVAEVGETVQLADLRLTVNGVSSLFDRPEAPPGFMFFLINYQLQNAGLAALDTSTLQFELRDEFGNQYALSPAASQLGNAPPLQGTINPGEVREATAGYQLPVGLSSPTLLWQVNRTGATAGSVQVTIPFATTSDGVANVAVMPQSAEVSLDGTSVTIVGQITNGGNQPLIVNETAVSLMSEGTIYLKLSTNPGFPWVVPAGQTMTFSISFQRPLTAGAVFTVLDQPFALEGLR